MISTKETMEKLAREWNWQAIKDDQLKRAFLRSPLIDTGQKITVPPDRARDPSRTFTFRHRREDGDFRIWTSTQAGLVQWRTDNKKGDRLVYRPFSKGANTERVNIEDIFMDPRNVDEGEAIMFDMMYAELVPLMPEFYKALISMEKELAEKLKKDKRKKYE